MSKFGTLGQVSPAATTLTACYTVPALKRAAVQVIICNTGAAAVTVRVAHAINGAANVPAQYILYDFSLAVAASYNTTKLALAAGDVIRVYASAANVAFNVNGVEDNA